MASDDNSASPQTQFNSERIKLLLKSEPNKYKVVKNESSSLKQWWQAFGYPTLTNKMGESTRIKGYVSCFKCFSTFIYHNRSGTIRLKQHAIKCSDITSSLSSITIINDDSSFAQSTLAQHGFKKSFILPEKDIENIKTLSVQWVCHDLRPFSILEDKGLHALAQDLIRIGICYFEFELSNNEGLFELGHKYGVVDVNEVLRSRHTISRTVYDLGDSYRQYIKQILIEPLKARAVTICPDFWSDCYKNISYLGLSITFVDVNYKMFSIDLFCRPFVGVKKHDLLLKALEKHLLEFGIDDITHVNIVSDRGSNFVAAFRHFQPLFCYGHRLNNILQKSFFANTKLKRDQGTTLPISNILNPINDEFSSEESSEDEEENMLPAIPVIRKKAANKNQQLVFKMSIDDVPIEAKNSGLNQEIENAGDGTVHQSVVTRWLSLIDTLESILKSFKIIKKVLASKQQQYLMNNITEKVIKQIILLLRPFKHVIKLIRTGYTPSLYMVLLTVKTLRDATSSYEALLNYNDNSSADHQSGDEHKESDEDLIDELEGISFFWKRIRCLLDEMFTLDIRHYAATLLHPKYRSLKFCSKELDKSKLESNPLSFWKEYKDKFPILSRYARSIHSIPATSTSVERQFSGAGWAINEIRTSLNPAQLDNILLIR
ncbi:unnamed protein product [Rotaria socialis]|uniref:HAT C-terminal dimerisation domain-containing protein n=1 Tax=Rotaria socialis TaxID=392032 RepID=A0A821TMN9_9BILA|nr:unnamed protein product [Rotaria socialis]